MNALADNRYTRAWRGLGAALRFPENAPAGARSASKAVPPTERKIRAVLVLSAHWATRGELAISAAADPGLLYDMYGFPDELYRVKYPASGHPELAAEIAARFANGKAGVSVRLDQERALDHGVWSVLVHMLAAADLPVLQLSYDEQADARSQLAVGRTLRGLRDEGVLIVGSGNLVHNLREIDFAENAAPADWALRFDRWIGAELSTLALARGRGEDEGLLRLAEPWEPAHGLSADLVAAAERSVPTLDHYVPFMQFLGTIYPGEAIGFPLHGIQNHSISMRGVQAGY